jgi:hypothetical protein
MTDQTAELFETTAAPEPERPPCWMTLVARQKLGQGEDWHWCKAERVGKDDLLIEGGIPGVYLKGKRKGRQKWDGVPLTKCVITRAETDQAQVNYEATTGKCRECGGSGQDWERWNHETGHHYRPCKRCGATGRAPEVMA